jgi:hypothetical protein
MGVHRRHWHDLGRHQQWLIKVTHDAGKMVRRGIPEFPTRAEVLRRVRTFDAAEAYAALGLYRLGDYTPYVFRTRDSAM